MFIHSFFAGTFANSEGRSVTYYLFCLIFIACGLIELYEGGSDKVDWLVFRMCIGENMLFSNNYSWYVENHALLL